MYCVDTNILQRFMQDFILGGVFLGGNMCVQNVILHIYVLTIAIGGPELSGVAFDEILDVKEKGRHSDQWGGGVG